MENKKGFTLVEVLAVIVIIGLLLTLVIPNVLKDVLTGKSDYNKKLENQLELAGKSYYGQHKNELPMANSGKSYSYVTVPEMKSKNFITNEFVDSEGNECSPSYIYVKPKSYNSDKYDYIPCLICQDKDGNQILYSDSPYCQITNWKDTEAPKCGTKKADGSFETINANYSSSNITITDSYDNGQITTMILRNLDKGSEHAIKLGKDTNISAINIKDKFKKYLTEDGKYEVVLIDEGGNESNACVTFKKLSDNICKAHQEGNKLTIIKAVSSEGFKNFYYKSSDGIEKQLVLKTNEQSKTIITNRDFTNVPKGAEIYFKDSNNTIVNCEKDDADEPGVPRCKFIKSHQGEEIRTKTTFQIECSMNGAYLEQNDLSKVQTTDKYGDIVKVTSNANDNNQAKTLIFDIEYKPTPGKNGQDEILTIGSGLVKNPRMPNKVNPEIATTFSVKTCIALSDKQYTVNSSESYANHGWSVVRDNGDSVALAYNGVFGSGGYSAANSYLDSNFINPSEVLKDAKTYGCLVDQGSNTYISTNSGTSSGYTDKSYWTSSSSFYNNTTYNHYSLNRAGFVNGYSPDALIPITTLTTSYSYATTTNKGIISSSSPYYSINGGTVTFINTSVSGPYSSGYLSTILQDYALAPSWGAYGDSPACSASSSSLCGRMYRYVMYWDPNTNISSYQLYNITQQKGNNTSSATFYLCGSDYHGYPVAFSKNSSVTFYYSALGAAATKWRYDTYHNFYFAGHYTTNCGSPRVGCTGSNPYNRYYYLYDSASGCNPVSYYNTSNSSTLLNYRPYIIVKKVK